MNVFENSIDGDFRLADSRLEIRFDRTRVWLPYDSESTAFKTEIDWSRTSTSS